MGMFDAEFKQILGRIDNIEFQLARIAFALENLKEKYPPRTP